jgi:two-component system sensor histidine kinase KdpD
LFSSVTHDLRTPLATIKAGITSLLEDDAVHDEASRRELLETALAETDRLNRLLGNLLDLARIEAGALTPSKEPVAIDEVVEAVLHRLEGRTGAVRVRTQFRESPDVLADPVQIDQVVTNLVENAVRFSPAGGEVTVSVAPWKNAVQVRVTDRGPGIPAGERERVFEAFYRGDADDRSGSGLGLAIVRAIVLAHGGRIRAEGSPAGGASVVFELPAVESKPGLVPGQTAIGAVTGTSEP